MVSLKVKLTLYYKKYPSIINRNYIKLSQNFIELNVRFKLYNSYLVINSLNYNYNYAIHLTHEFINLIIK